MAWLRSVPPLAGVLLLSFAPLSAQDAPRLTSELHDYQVVTVAEGLENPWAIAFVPGGDILITEKAGRLRVYADGELSEPIEGVPRVEFQDQGGLLDVEIDPDFASNGLVYLSYSEAAGQQPEVDGDESDPRLGEFQDLSDAVLKGAAVARGKLDGRQLRDVEVIWRQEPKTIGRGHFGGRLAFAPDGTLFISSGDRQRFEPSQDLGSNIGKIVRINADGSIPDDNPFVNEDDARGDIWALGIRNALGLGFSHRTAQLPIEHLHHHELPEAAARIRHLEGIHHGATHAVAECSRVRRRELVHLELVDQLLLG